MKALIVHGSKMGGTAGLAYMLGEDLQGVGFDVSVRPARSTSEVEGYDAMVVGGALYAAWWHKDARRFVKRNAEALRKTHVWLFSSGPLDDSALLGDIPPVRFLQKTMERVGAEGHITFGGRLSEDASGFPASVMAKEQAGDWRDRDQVQHWAKEITEELDI